MKLKVNDIILVHGWVMLNGLDDGQKYKVHSTPDYYGQPTYQFTKLRGKKIVRHYMEWVDGWVKDTDLNRIEVLNGV